MAASPDPSRTPQCPRRSFTTQLPSHSGIDRRVSSLHPTMVIVLFWLLAFAIAEQCGRLVQLSAQPKCCRCKRGRICGKQAASRFHCWCRKQTKERKPETRLTCECQALVAASANYGTHTSKHAAIAGPRVARDQQRVSCAYPAEARLARKPIGRVNSSSWT